MDGDVFKYDCRTDAPTAADIQWDTKFNNNGLDPYTGKPWENDVEKFSQLPICKGSPYFEQLGKGKAVEIGPRRINPYLAVQEERERDPHEYRDRQVGGHVIIEAQSRQEQLTGSSNSLNPQWRRKPRYRTRIDGQAEMCFAEDPAREADN